MAVVVAVVGADFNFTRDPTVANTAVTLALVANTVAVAFVRAFAHSAVGPRVAWLAHTSAVVAVTVDAFAANTCGAVGSCPSSLALANTVHTLAPH